MKENNYRGHTYVGRDWGSRNCTDVGIYPSQIACSLLFSRFNSELAKIRQISILKHSDVSRLELHGTWSFKTFHWILWMQDISRYLEPMWWKSLTNISMVWSILGVAGAALNNWDVAIPWFSIVHKVVVLVNAVRSSCTIIHRINRWVVRLHFQVSENEKIRPTDWLLIISSAPITMIDYRLIFYAHVHFTNCEGNFV